MLSTPIFLRCGLNFRRDIDIESDVAERYSSSNEDILLPVNNEMWVG
ncbi:hypothetical protein SacN8_00715 [Sulfolobus acidocaldarius N8]|uniref:Uncharacterized protein n=2 Tax=Sulfolobus acidocaldarius TaxID=2285 RepID=M1IYS4_9CREN|nr:hypothetical protein SacN8_00715 [Sulfolobus acidocaldarius N8]AGE72399.1 hypothetical protein SacRon12I_00715 [Sulfolobus acidocaldarius Ron12/I]